MKQKESQKKRFESHHLKKKGGKNHKNWNFLANNPKSVRENGQDSPTTKFNRKTKEKRAEKAKERSRETKNRFSPQNPRSKNAKETRGERPEKRTAALEGEESRKTILDKSKRNQSH